MAASADDLNAATDARRKGAPYPPLRYQSGAEFFNKYRDSKGDSMPSYMSNTLAGPAYHYTSAVGLIGIFSNRVLWASDCMFLNDRNELHEFEDVCEAVIADNGAGFPRETLDGVQAVLDSRRGLSTLSVSLSEEGDLLSQWRAYCPREGGYSIGFKPDFWKKLKASFSFSFLKCIYDEPGQRRALEELIAMMEPSTRKGWKDSFELTSRYLRPLMKHPSFHEEKEWRIVCLDPTDIIPGLKYRPAANLIVPFFEMQIEGDMLPIEEVVIGPCSDPAMAERGLRKFLAAIQQDQIQIRRSASTLR